MTAWPTCMVSGKAAHTRALRNALAGRPTALECFRLLAAEMAVAEPGDTCASGVEG